jgi:NAD+ synthase (glutamine-hydrolysing)
MENYGFVTVAAGVPLVKVADCQSNIGQMEQLMRKAAERSVQVIAFPELSVTSYTCLDLFAQQTLLDEAEKALLKLVKETADLEMLAIVGVPLVTENRLINAAVAFQKGEILGVVRRHSLHPIKNFRKSVGLPLLSRFTRIISALPVRIIR